MKTQWAYWACQVAGWGAYSAVAFAITIAFVGSDPGIVVGFALFFGYSIGLTHLLRYVIRQRQWLMQPPMRGLPRTFGSALAVGLLQTGLVVGLARLGQHPFDSTAVISAASGIVFMTCAWTAIYVGVQWYRRYRQAQIREMQARLSLQDAELRALQAQVNPHFLFNALNTIRGAVAENPRHAQDMITSLANLFRRSLQSKGAQMVPLSEELEAVSDYLALESARFEERLRVRLEVCPEAERCEVPSMLVQTLVENSVKHGIATLPGGGTISVRGTVDERRLILEVENTGRLRASDAAGTRTGLANARQRLHLLCGANASLDLVDSDGTVTATVVIPQPA